MSCYRRIIPESRQSIIPSCLANSGPSVPSVLTCYLNWPLTSCPLLPPPTLPLQISVLCYTSSLLTNASSRCIFAIASCPRRCVAHYQDFDPLITTHRALSGWPLGRPGPPVCARDNFSMWNALKNRPITQTSGARAGAVSKAGGGDKVWEHPWSKSDFIVVPPGAT